MGGSTACSGVIRVGPNAAAGDQQPLLASWFLRVRLDAEARPGRGPTDVAEADRFKLNCP